MFFPIQYDGIFLIIEDGVSNGERNIKESLESVFESVLYGPSVISVGVNSIKVVVVLAPYKSLNFFTNGQTLHEFIVFIAFVNVAF